MVGDKQSRDHQHVRTQTFVSVVRLAKVRGNIFMLLATFSCYWQHFHVIEHIFSILDFILIYFSEIFDFDYFGGKRNTFFEIGVFIKIMQRNVIFVLLGIKTT